MIKKTTRAVVTVIAASALAVFLPAGSAAAVTPVKCTSDLHPHHLEAYLRFESNQDHDHCFRDGGIAEVHIDARWLQTGYNDVTLTFAGGEKTYFPRSHTSPKRTPDNMNDGWVYLNRVVTFIRIH